MISDAIALFRARKDRQLAMELARELTVDQAIDKASFPLTFVKFWMGVALFLLTLVGGLILMAAMASHWSVGILAMPFFALDYLIVRIWRGLNRGYERVKHIAHEQSAAALDIAQQRFQKPQDTEQLS